MADEGASFRGRLFYCLIVSLVFVGQPPAGAAGSGSSPNIIVVMADDHAQWALGSYGQSAPQHRAHQRRIDSGRRRPNWVCGSTDLPGQFDG